MPVNSNTRRNVSLIETINVNATDMFNLDKSLERTVLMKFPQLRTAALYALCNVDFSWSNNRIAQTLNNLRQKIVRK